MSFKYKVYIITYDNNKILNECLQSLFESNFDSFSVEINIIDNHSNAVIEDKFVNNVNLINNNLRPDFSTGHLSRNWNQCIINGFKNLQNPDCEAVIALQNDTLFAKKWYFNLEKLLIDNNFITEGIGDQFQVFTPLSIKLTGLYDERFCNIGYQEADYFLRSIIYNPHKSIINDYHHLRLWRNYDGNELIVPSESGNQRNDLNHIDSKKYHNISKKIFDKKWGPELINWNGENFDKLIYEIKPKIESYIYYPYFEKDILTLKWQNYDYDLNMEIDRTKIISNFINAIK